MSIILDNVNYVYSEGNAYLKHALKDINLVIGEKEFIGLIGHTGSGKSTLAQILNGLLKPSQGNMFYNGQDVGDETFDRKELRQKVGLVFQYPEHQLFETTVFKDVCYGPMKMGLDKKTYELRAFEALTLAGVENELFYRSPLELSGGQKRRAAIAGVLAMKPEVLVLDEPTAGLDPRGREEVLTMISELREKTGTTIILISHNMEDIAEYADRIVVMNEGEIVFDGDKQTVFAQKNVLEEIGLAAPEITGIMTALAERGLSVDTKAVTINEGVDSIIDALNRKGIFRC
jgi:energy-coupling factor transport system ATP-binding protein